YSSVLYIVQKSGYICKTLSFRYMTKFNTYLESNDFDRLKRFFEEHGELQHYRKGNFFARQGEYSSQAALIKDGTFAYTHIDNDGKEHYVGFVFPDEFVADYTSFM